MEATIGKAYKVNVTVRAMRGGEWEPYATWLRVPALGLLAVTPFLGDEPKRRRRVITHIPTGYKFAMFDTLKEALAKLPAFVDAADWDFYDKTDPRCKASYDALKSRGLL